MFAPATALSCKEVAKECAVKKKKCRKKSITDVGEVISHHRYYIIFWLLLCFWYLSAGLWLHGWATSFTGTEGPILKVVHSAVAVLQFLIIVSLNLCFAREVHWDTRVWNRGVAPAWFQFCCLLTFSQWALGCLLSCAPGSLASSFLLLPSACCHSLLRWVPGCRCGVRLTASEWVWLS